MPNVGYINNKKTRFMLPNGFFKFTVNNAKVKTQGSRGRGLMFAFLSRRN